MLKTGAVFGNGMVLQQQSIVAVFGETDCDCIEATWEEENVDEACFKADINDGKWMLDLPTGEAVPNTESISHTLTIVGKKNGEETDRRTIFDIVFGEVWFAGGQSNMELELKDSFNGETVADSTDYEYIRFYNVPKCPVIDEELFRCESESGWQRAKGEPARYMSAVGFYFAQKLYKSLGVPIGIIDCYWGGTSATCWITREKTTDILEVQEYIGGWDEVCRSKSDEVFEKEMANYQALTDDWVARLENLKKQDPNVDWDVINEVVGPYPWPLPQGRKSPFRPFGLHETMVKRVAPYTVKGFIYYQGEEDCARASGYSRLNAKVIEQWREDFALPCETGAGSYENKPFYLTQLPAFKAGEENGDTGWIEIRQQQALCAANTPNTGIAVTIDSGEKENIHPLDKMTPGYRLAEQALFNTYKSEDGFQNCILKEFEFRGDECELIFEGTYGGLCYRMSDGKELTALKENRPLESAVNESGMESNRTAAIKKIRNGAVWGLEVSSDGEHFYTPEIYVKEDRLVVKAVGEIDGKTISDVRYGWINYGVANIYSKSGVPVMPFWKKSSI